MAAGVAREGKVRELKVMIRELEQQRAEKVKVHYPGIDRLKVENEGLRQKTISNLRTFKQEEQEEQELAHYLQQEEQNRNRFLLELKQFKADYKQLKA